MQLPGGGVQEWTSGHGYMLCTFLWFWQQQWSYIWRHCWVRLCCFVPHLRDQLFWRSISQSIFLKTLMPLKMLVLYEKKKKKSEVERYCNQISLGILDLVHSAIKLRIGSFSCGETSKLLLTLVIAGLQPGTMRSLHLSLSDLIFTTSPWWNLLL